MSRPAMTRRLPRILLPVLLLVAGVCALVYGAGVRSVPILAEVMVEKEETIYERPSVPWQGNRGPGQPGPMLPPPPPRPRKVKKQVAQEQIQATGEPRIIREVTVGGLARLQDGRIRLTYRAGEDGPALCPT